jgi:UDPglucose 6-dehydrogenase
VQRINQNQIDRFVKKIKDTLWVLKGKRIAVWGLTFKPDTDDVRNSVAIELVGQLLREGAIVQAYDPKGADKVAEFNLCTGAVLAKSALAAVENAEALVLATEWNEFQSVDFLQVRKIMHTPLIFDGRNLFDPNTMRELGFTYHGIGRARAR